MAYPDGLDALKADYAAGDRADVVDHAGMHNAERAAINAIEAELGTNPKGSKASVKARLDAVDADARWTDARTPTAHKASHAAGGGDDLSPADIGAATSAQGAKADAAVPSTLVDAKGDLLVGTAADTVARLPVGADGQVLVSDSSTAEGVAWLPMFPQRTNGASGSFIIPGETFTTKTSNPTSTAFGSPVLIGSAVTIDALAIDITANSAVDTRSWLLGVARLAPSGWVQLATASVGIVAGATGIQVATLSTPLALPPGYYVPFARNNGGTAVGLTVRTVNQNCLVTGLLTRTAFDASTARSGGFWTSGSPVTAWAESSTTTPAVGMRLA